jgi:hypothetical protein
MKQRIAISLLVNLGWFLSSCAPLFSDMHSARLVGKKEFELTPGYSSVGIVEEGENSGVNNFLGVQGAYGVSDKVELRFRIEHSWLKKSAMEGEDEQMTADVVGFGVKFGIVKDRLALFLPVGYGAGLIEFQPTILGTVPVIRNKIDFNPSVKHLLRLNMPWQPLVAVNFGFAISSDVRKWAIRPEYGLLYNLDGQGHFKNFSVGLSFNLSALSRSE